MLVICVLINVHIINFMTTVWSKGPLSWSGASPGTTKHGPTGPTNNTTTHTASSHPITSVQVWGARQGGGWGGDKARATAPTHGETVGGRWGTCVAGGSSAVQVAPHSRLNSKKIFKSLIRKYTYIHNSMSNIYFDSDLFCNY